MSAGPEEPVDLGTITAREVPHAGGPAAAPTGVPPRSEPLPVPFEKRSLASILRQIRGGTGRMVDDIVEVRRGPIPNSRPVPEWVRGLAWLLDESVPIAPGRRVGIDGLASFVPAVGDAAGIVAGSVVVVAGVASGVSLPTLLRMLWNLGLDAVIGAVPFLGALFDLAYKSNTRNLRLIEADLHDRAGTKRSGIKIILMSSFAIFACVFLVVVAFSFSVYLFVRLVGRIL